MRTQLLKIRRIYRFVPTCLTLGNSVCGFIAILNTCLIYRAVDTDVPRILVTSAWLIGGAMLFDMLDGWTARKLHASSEYGVEMDSLADMVTFGVAPAVMVAMMAHADVLGTFGWLSWRWVWVACGVYVCCTALRLALYNVLTHRPSTESADAISFHGLPSPGAAAAICSIVVLYRSDSVSDDMVTRLVQVLPFYLVILAGLMVSSFPYLHVGKWLGNKKRNKLKIFLLIVFFLFFAYRPPLTIAVAVNVYIFLGPVGAVVKRFSSRYSQSSGAG